MPKRTRVAEPQPSKSQHEKRIAVARKKYDLSGASITCKHQSGCLILVKPVFCLAALLPCTCPAQIDVLFSDGRQGRIDLLGDLYVNAVP